MESIGVKELRDQLSRVLREVERGRGVRILRHGVPVAELQPVAKSEAQAVRQRLQRIGVLGGGNGRVRKCQPIAARPGSRQVSDWVIEERR